MSTTVSNVRRPHPVALTVDRPPTPSRLLWLIKWLLALPHFIVLVVLWVALLVLSVIAFFAILFTGRYPRALFDFNVGVLRWGWRVSYYSYGALGTDVYPPFSLEEDPNYPAHLEIAYPEHLSRGLVLVKWWLLAIPQYIVVGVITGSGGQWVTLDNGQREWVSTAPGLLYILVFFAAVIVAFTGNYPRSVHDLVVGLNRWTVRVAAYALLMTDIYPPLRLDQGPNEPVLTTTPPDAPPPPAAPPQPPGAPIQGGPR